MSRENESTAGQELIAAQQKGRVRLSLDVSADTNALLEELARVVGGTKSDVLRKGIALMEIAVRAKQQNRKLGVAEKDQPLVTEIVGL
jgi:hypothetical protein